MTLTYDYTTAEWRDPMDEHLIYCLNAGFPAAVIEAMLVLANDYSTLEQAWQAWKKSDEDEDYGDYDVFIDAVEEMTSESCCFCDDCGAMVWSDQTTMVASGDRVCDDSCRDKYTKCDSCDEFYTDTTCVDEMDYCEQCLQNNCSYCDTCEEYYRDGNEENHHHGGCHCDVPHRYFDFPADGYGTVSQNERLTFELPKGTIDGEGLCRITQLLQGSISGEPRYHVDEVIESVGPLWQAKRGNFTKRVSSAFYTMYQVKIDPSVLSEIGNVARAHSSDAASWNIEFTRDLNESAAYFFHEESCWWGSYSLSRCCLKNWGGLALRSFGPHGNYPTGRAWVQPLNTEMRPTHDALNAHAYVVFNGYGELDGYVAARLVAHLSGRTYRKIDFNGEDIYVNGQTGYLVADETTCENADSLFFTFDPHSRHDA